MLNKHLSKSPISSYWLHTDRVTASDVNSSRTVQQENVMAAVGSFPTGQTAVSSRKRNIPARSECAEEDTPHCTALAAEPRQSR